MKAISVRQPWAWAIIHAGKDIENRTWKTRFRGEVAIHAAGKRDSDSELPKRSKKPNPADLVCGAILGVVEIVDVVDDSKSKWFQGEYGSSSLTREPSPSQSPAKASSVCGICQRMWRGWLRNESSVKIDRGRRPPCSVTSVFVQEEHS
jgi:hypothetical protein